MALSYYFSEWDAHLSAWVSNCYAAHYLTSWLIPTAQRCRISLCIFLVSSSSPSIAMDMFPFISEVFKMNWLNFYFTECEGLADEECPRSSDCDYDSDIEAMLADEKQAAGMHMFCWDVKDLSFGL